MQYRHPMSYDDDFHPDSKWEEPYTHHNLTLYDLHRIPRPTQEGRLSVPTKNLNSEFICPVCLGYMRKTSLVMECLHRFCGECIQKCLRLGKKKECPSCRIHIPSRRSLRHDPEFDLLLKHILGDVRVLEAEEERQAELAKTRSKLFAVTRKRGMVHQAMQQNKNKKSKTVDAATTERAFLELGRSEIEEKTLELLPDTNLMHMKSTSLVEVWLRRQEGETRIDKLRKDLITVSENAPISCLKTFLSRKLNYEPKKHITVVLQFHGTWVALEDSMTLGEIRRHLSMQDEVLLTLRYRVIS